MTAKLRIPSSNEHVITNAVWSHDAATRINKDKNAFGHGFSQHRDVNRNQGCQRALEGQLYGA